MKRGILAILKNLDVGSYGISDWEAPYVKSVLDFYSLGNKNLPSMFRQGFATTLREGSSGMLSPASSKTATAIESDQQKAPTSERKQAAAEKSQTDAQPALAPGVSSDQVSANGVEEVGKSSLLVKSAAKTQEVKEKSKQPSVEAVGDTKASNLPPESGELAQKNPSKVQSDTYLPASGYERGLVLAASASSALPESVVADSPGSGRAASQIIANGAEVTPPSLLVESAAKTEEVKEESKQPSVEAVGDKKSPNPTQNPGPAKKKRKKKKKTPEGEQQPDPVQVAQQLPIAETAIKDIEASAPGRKDRHRKDESREAAQAATQASGPSATAPGDSIIKDLEAHQVPGRLHTPPDAAALKGTTSSRIGDPSESREGGTVKATREALASPNIPLRKIRGLITTYYRDNAPDGFFRAVSHQFKSKGWQLGSIPDLKKAAGEALASLEQNKGNFANLEFVLTTYRTSAAFSSQKYKELRNTIWIQALAFNLQIKIVILTASSPAYIINTHNKDFTQTIFLYLCENTGWQSVEEIDILKSELLFKVEYLKLERMGIRTPKLVEYDDQEFLYYLLLVELNLIGYPITQTSIDLMSLAVICLDKYKERILNRLDPSIIKSAGVAVDNFLRDTTKPTLPVVFHLLLGALAFEIKVNIVIVDLGLGYTKIAVFKSDEPCSPNTIFVFKDKQGFWKSSKWASEDLTTKVRAHLEKEGVPFPDSQIKYQQSTASASAARCIAQFNQIDALHQPLESPLLGLRVTARCIAQFNQIDALHQPLESPLLGFIVVDVPGGADCFFHACVSSLQYINSKHSALTHLQLRKIAVDYMQANTHQFDNLLGMTHKQLSEYFQSMGENAWVDDATIQAVAERLKINILMLHIVEDNSLASIRLTQKEGTAETETVVVSYYRKLPHWQSVTGISDWEAPCVRAVLNLYSQKHKTLPPPMFRQEVATTLSEDSSGMLSPALSKPATAIESDQQKAPISERKQAAAAEEVKEGSEQHSVAKKKRKKKKKTPEGEQQPDPVQGAQQLPIAETAIKDIEASAPGRKDRHLEDESREAAQAATQASGPSATAPGDSIIKDREAHQVPGRLHTPPDAAALKGTTSSRIGGSSESRGTVKATREALASPNIPLGKIRGLITTNYPDNAPDGFFRAVSHQFKSKDWPCGSIPDLRKAAGEALTSLEKNKGKFANLEFVLTTYRTSAACSSQKYKELRNPILIQALAFYLKIKIVILTASSPAYIINTHNKDFMRTIFLYLCEYTGWQSVEEIDILESEILFQVEYLKLERMGIRTPKLVEYDNQAYFYYLLLVELNLIGYPITQTSIDLMSLAVICLDKYKERILNRLDPSIIKSSGVAVDNFLRDTTKPPLPVVFHLPLGALAFEIKVNIVIVDLALGYTKIAVFKSDEPCSPNTIFVFKDKQGFWKSSKWASEDLRRTVRAHLEKEGVPFPDSQIKYKSAVTLHQPLESPLLGFRIADVPCGENSFFHACVSSLQNSKHSTLTHVQLRQMAVNYMQAHIKKFSGLPSRPEALLKYFRSMRKNEWVDDPTIQALAAALKINIFILHIEENNSLTQTFFKHKKGNGFDETETVVVSFYKKLPHWQSVTGISDWEAPCVRAVLNLYSQKHKTLPPPMFRQEVATTLSEDSSGMLSPALSKPATAIESDQQKAPISERKQAAAEEVKEGSEQHSVAKKKPKKKKKTPVAQQLPIAETASSATVPGDSIIKDREAHQVPGRLHTPPDAAALKGTTSSRSGDSSELREGGTVNQDVYKKDPKGQGSALALHRSSGGPVGNWHLTGMRDVARAVLIHSGVMSIDIHFFIAAGKSSEALGIYLWRLHAYSVTHHKTVGVYILHKNHWLGVGIKPSGDLYFMDPENSPPDSFMLKALIHTGASIIMDRGLCQERSDTCGLVMQARMILFVAGINLGSNEASIAHALSDISAVVTHNIPPVEYLTSSPINRADLLVWQAQDDRSYDFQSEMEQEFASFVWLSYKTAMVLRNYRLFLYFLPRIMQNTAYEFLKYFFWLPTVWYTAICLKEYQLAHIRGAAPTLSRLGAHIIFFALREFQFYLMQYYNNGIGVIFRVVSVMQGVYNLALVVPEILNSLSVLSTTAKVGLGFYAVAPLAAPLLSLAREYVQFQEGYQRDDIEIFLDSFAPLASLSVVLIFVVHAGVAVSSINIVPILSCAYVLSETVQATFLVGKLVGKEIIKGFGAIYNSDCVQQGIANCAHDYLRSPQQRALETEFKETVNSTTDVSEEHAHFISPVSVSGELDSHKGAAD